MFFLIFVQMNFFCPCADSNPEVAYSLLQPEGKTLHIKNVSNKRQQICVDYYICVQSDVYRSLPKAQAVYHF